MNVRLHLMTAPALRSHTAMVALGAVSAFAVAISTLLVAFDWLNHGTPSVVHVSAVALSVCCAGVVGAFSNSRTPWFGWLAYGAMLASSILCFALIAAIAITRKAPNDPNITQVLVASVLLFAGAFPAVLVARKRARGTSGAI